MIYFCRQPLAVLVVVALAFPAASEAGTSPAKSVTVTYDYDAFGNLLHSTGSTPNNYLFAGEQFDPDLGLYYNRARYLSTSTARFWSMDTFEGDDESPLSLHKFLYANGDPVGGIDPTGNDDIAELSASQAVDQVLNVISGVQKLVEIKNRVVSVFDLLSAVRDLAGAFSNPSNALTVALYDLENQLGYYKKASLRPYDIFDSITRNAGRIAEENVAHRLPQLAKALQTPGTRIGLYMPTLFNIPQDRFNTDLSIGKYGVDIVIGGKGGGRLLGVGLKSGDDAFLIFRVDFSLRREDFSKTPRDDYARWLDPGNSFLHYHVPRGE